MGPTLRSSPVYISFSLKSLPLKQKVVPAVHLWRHPLLQILHCTSDQKHLQTAIMVTTPTEFSI